MALEAPRRLEKVSPSASSSGWIVILTSRISFPFGWLFLPVDLIGRPFSQKTRDHFLPLLTSTHWWSQTQLALRRVFQLDPDFQERMFARQMAVMKGQAWNVVETLKTADHGPLELTRRAKVCVWDDLVDVPVAVPMRVASAEMRHRAAAESESAAAAAAAATSHRSHKDKDKARSDIIDEADEEMDIGAANTSSDGGSSSAPATAGAGAGTSTVAVVDLLGNASPPADLPHPGRFELAMADELPSPSPLGNGNGTATPSPKPDVPASDSKPARPQFNRASQSHRTLNMYSPDRGDRPSAANAVNHQRRFSFTTAAGRRESNSIAAQLYASGSGGGGGRSSQDYGFNYRDRWDGGDDDDDELEGGDLGYAAATGMEGNQRKVIVERLEPVKSRNPVFTWC